MCAGKVVIVGLMMAALGVMVTCGVAAGGCVEFAAFEASFARFAMSSAVNSENELDFVAFVVVPTFVVAVVVVVATGETVDGNACAWA